MSPGGEAREEVGAREVRREREMGRNKRMKKENGMWNVKEMGYGL